MALIAGAARARTSRIGAAAGGAVVLISPCSSSSRSPRARRRTTSSPLTRRAAGSRGSAAREACRRVTPLLRKGDRRYTDEIFNGLLPGGLSGSLPSTPTRRPRPTRRATATRPTTTSPWPSPSFPRPRRSCPSSHSSAARASGSWTGAEDVFRTRQRVEVESELADKKFEIFTGKNDDMVRARQVFSPTFIVWLAEDAHEGIAFELVAGAFVANSRAT